MNRIGVALGALGAAGAVGTWALGRSLRDDDDSDGLTAPLTDLVRGLGGELQFVRGAGIEAVNVLGHHVHLPFAPKGTVFEPHGEMQHAGADMIDAIGRVFGAVPDAMDPADTREDQPLLAAERISVAAEGPTTLGFHAKTDADWGEAGSESVLAAIYVDGEYVSDMPLMGERDEPYRVLLGELAAGEHQVEIRIAQGSPITDPSKATITSVSATASRQPLVDRYAPILEGRDLGRAGGRPEWGYTDAPLVVNPVVTRNEDGTTRIDYHALFSNEDGGTATGDLMHKYGRITDYEPIYTVLVDEHGERISDSFQTSGHNWMGFDGEREGDRPVMRIGTDNNLMTSLARDDGHRWTGAPTRATDASLGARAIMNRHAWTWSVMGRELDREDKEYAVRRLDERTEQGDPRDVLYVAQPAWGNLPDSPKDVLHVTLAEGRRIDIRNQRLERDGVTAVRLPDGVSPLDVVRVEGIASGAYVLDEDFQPREIDVVQPLPKLEKPPVAEPAEPRAPSIPPQATSTSARSCRLAYRPDRVAG